jgi:hypothetical protein
MNIPSYMTKQAYATVERLGTAPRTIPAGFFERVRFPRASSRCRNGLFIAVFCSAATALTLAAGFVPSYDRWEGPKFWVCLVTFGAMSVLGVKLVIDGSKTRAICRQVIAEGQGTVGIAVRSWVRRTAGMVTDLTLDVGYLDAAEKKHRIKGQWPVTMRDFDPTLWVAGAPVVVIYDRDHSERAAIFPLDYEGADLSQWTGQAAAALHAAASVPSTSAGPDAVLQAWQIHYHELQGIPGGQRRGEIMMLWHEKLDQEAHDLTDLIVEHARHNEIAQLEAEVIMQAYLAGHMARRGWIQEREARYWAYVLGRSFRDRLRELGVAIDTCNAAVGIVTNHALERIVELGLTQDP